MVSPVSFLVFLALALTSLVKGTAEFYANGHGCDPPVEGEIYMGARAKKSNRIKITMEIHDLEKAETADSVEDDGNTLPTYFDDGELYEILLTSDSWDQWVVHVDSGHFERPSEESVDEDPSNNFICNDQSVLIGAISKEVTLYWRAPLTSPNPFILTIGVAPHYGAIEVQKWLVPHHTEARTKTDL